MSPDVEAQDGTIPLLPLESLHPEGPEDRRVGSLLCACLCVRPGPCAQGTCTPWPPPLPLPQDSKQEAGPVQGLDSRCRGD